MTPLESTRKLGRAGALGRRASTARARPRCAPCSVDLCRAEAVANPSPPTHHHLLDMLGHPLQAQVRMDDAKHFIACGRAVIKRRLAEAGRPGGPHAAPESDADVGIAFVVGTDRPGIIAALRAEMGDADELVWYDAVQDDGTGRSNGSETSSERAGHQLKRAVDHFLLSLCDAVVISHGSTFGLTAAHLQPGTGPHYSIGRHYHHAWAEPMCEPSPCPLRGPCFDRTFGYFGLCDEGYAYGHGEEFLEWAAKENARGVQPPVLSLEPT